MPDISLHLLKPHPRNLEIYGKEDVTWLVDRIKKSNWVKELICTPDLVIVSGHTRYEAAKILNLQTLPVKIDHSLIDPLDILERLLDENKTREKNNLQHINETEAYEEIIKGRNYTVQKDEGEKHGIKGKEHGVKGGRPKKTPLATRVAKGVFEEEKPKTKKKQNNATRTVNQATKKQGGNISGRSYERGKVAKGIAENLGGNKCLLVLELIKTNISGAEKVSKIVHDITENQASGFLKQLKNGKASTSIIKSVALAIEENKIKDQYFKATPIDAPRAVPTGNNMFEYSSQYSETRYGDKIFSLSDQKYNTVSTLSRFYHRETMLEFSLREYADVQTFPGSFKFIGNETQIKKQIGNAVAPYMGQYITRELKGKTVGDLFAGCGGFTCGIHQNGLISKWAIEWNEDAANSYKMNFPETKVFNENIKALNPNDFELVDVIVGGPPCQGFSSANHENKKVLAKDRFADDPRNELYKEFLRFVDVLKPNEFIMENVPEIQDVKDEIILDFEGIGYSVKTKLIIGNEIGMKQNRKRFFFIGKKI